MAAQELEGPENTQRRSARTRNLDATINKRQQLSEIISRPAQNRRKQPAPPTSGERGQALASQQRSKSRTSQPVTAEPTQSDIPPFVPIPYTPDTMEQVPTEAHVANPLPQSPVEVHYPALLGFQDTYQNEDPFSFFQQLDSNSYNENNVDYDPEADRTLRAAPPTNFFPSDDNANVRSISLDSVVQAPIDYNQYRWAHQQHATSSSTSNQAPDPSLQGWMADPLPPHSVIQDLNHPQAMPAAETTSGSERSSTSMFTTTGHPTDTLKDHQERRGSAAVPNPAMLASFSTSVPPPRSNSSWSVSSRPHSRVQQPYQRAPYPPSHTPSQYSETSTTDWSMASHISERYEQRRGPDGHPRAVLVRRKRRTQAELPQGHQSLSQQEKQIVLSAQAILSIDILVRHPFPDRQKKTSLSEEAYAQAYVQIVGVTYNSGIRPTPSPQALKSVKATFSVIRIALKKVCDAKVPLFYALYPPRLLPEEGQKGYIAQTVHALLEHGAYTKEKEGAGYFGHPALFAITKEFCYNPRNGLARGYEHEFGPLFPLNFIALVFSCICCILNSYSTGEHRPQDFSAKDYLPTFNRILADLHEIVEGTNERRKEKLKNVRRRLFDLRLEVQDQASTSTSLDTYLDSDSDE